MATSLSVVGGYGNSKPLVKVPQVYVRAPEVDDGNSTGAGTDTGEEDVWRWRHEGMGTF